MSQTVLYVIWFYYFLFALAFFLWFILRMHDGARLGQALLLTMVWPLVVLIIMLSFMTKTTRGERTRSGRGYQGRHEGGRHRGLRGSRLVDRRY